MQPNDLARLISATDPRIDASGTRTAYTVGRPDPENDRYERSIWISDPLGARQFTAGPRDTAPRWSPTGLEIAFLRSPEDGKPAQAAVIPFGGGEPSVITDFEFGVEALEWSPDSSRLVVVAVTPTESWEDADEDERKRRPRQISSIPYRFDNVGWMDDRRRHLWLVDPTGEDDPRCLTPGEFDESAPTWSPDGSTIAFITDRDPGRGMSPGNDVFEVDVATGELTRVGGRGFWVAVSYRPDGVLHLLGHDAPEYPSINSLYRRESDGTLADLTADVDRNLGVVGVPPILRWDGDSALVGLEDSGEGGLVRVATDGSVERLVEGRLVVTGADVANERIAFTATTWDRPGEVFYLEADGPAQVTDLFTEELGLVEPEHFRVGPNEVDTWVYLPEGDGPVPLLLNIHGGPATQYGFGFFDEFQVYVSAGFGVVACNPRGSSGRGLDWVKAVAGDGWGVVDLEDITAVVDEALERYPRLDPGRMGIMGGSYGGFMTSWTIAHEDRWRSAVVERALTNFASFAGTSDIGATFPHMYTGADYPDAWETWWKKSPLAYAHRVTTPTLVVHSENDFRCPIEQGEQYFTALLRNGTPTKMVRFPGEGHELTRSGKPKHRLERFEIILDWHTKHLLSET